MNSFGRWMVVLFLIQNQARALQRLPISPPKTDFRDLMGGCPEINVVAKNKTATLGYYQVGCKISGLVPRAVFWIVNNTFITDYTTVPTEKNQKSIATFSFVKRISANKDANGVHSCAVVIKNGAICRSSTTIANSPIFYDKPHYCKDYLKFYTVVLLSQIGDSIFVPCISAHNNARIFAINKFDSRVRVVENGVRVSRLLWKDMGNFMCTPNATNKNAHSLFIYPVTNFLSS